jgi:hypothetical protein
MVDGRLGQGEPVYRAAELMLRDILHFTKAPLLANRDEDYKVVVLRLVEVDGELVGETVVEAASGGDLYTLSDKELVELGAELIYARMGA